MNRDAGTGRAAGAPRPSAGSGAAEDRAPGPVMGPLPSLREGSGSFYVIVSVYIRATSGGARSSADGKTGFQLGTGKESKRGRATPSME